MENAGIACVEEILKRYPKQARRAAVVCGPGNNGGDGFVIARQLFCRGYAPQVLYFQKPAQMNADPRINWTILKKLKVSMTDCAGRFSERKFSRALDRSALVVDALFGTGLAREIKGNFSRVIELMNLSGRPTVSVDVPSGLNADSGTVMGACVKASLTVTFGLAKPGLLSNRRQVGDVVIKNISLPPVLLTGRR